MKRLLVMVALALGACGGETVPRTLVWSDEFDGPPGPPDRARWSFDLGGDGWGNGELQFYSDGNAALDGAGHLVITARSQPAGARAFTSARLSTRGRLELTHGRVEARLRLPAGKGLWPAFWLLGANIDQVGWPACGEIDVVEARGAQPWRVSSALHGPGYSGGTALIAAFERPDRAPLTGDFHDFAVDWSPGQVEFFVDGQPYHTERASRISHPWVFDHPFFLILNLAVGGNFGGPPDETTPFPAELVADHVRVYR
jgi:beta-glucanase (GH16 family)